MGSHSIRLAPPIILTLSFVLSRRSHHSPQKAKLMEDINSIPQKVILSDLLKVWAQSGHTVSVTVRTANLLKPQK